MARLLEEDIQALQMLDGQRERCRDLLEAAARTLFSWSHAESRYNGDDDDDWASATDDVERAMVLRSLNMIKRHSLISSPEIDQPEIRKLARRYRARLRTTDLSSLYKKRSSRHKTTRPSYNDRIPVFRACHTIQALVEDDAKNAGPFCAASLNCVYRLMTDIYRAESPDWMLGGVRASLDAPQSAFITREAVRSILLIRRSVTNTRNLIDELRRADREWHASVGAPHSWRTRMSELRRTNFSTSFRTQWPHLLNTAMRIDETNNWTGAASRAVLDHLRYQWNTLSTNLATFSGPGDLTVTPEIHDRVTAILKDIHDTVLDKLGTSPTVTPGQQLDDVSTALKEVRAAILRILEPSEVFLETVLLKQVSADFNRTAAIPDAAEAAFAAAALTDIRRAKDSFDSDDLHLHAATSLAVDSLSERGMLQSAAPFDVWGKGYRLLPQSAETIRAMSDILSFSNVDCEPETARRLVRYFLETRANRPPTQAGWRSDIGTKKGKTEVWATALALFSLIELREMLDKQINRRVLVHFTVRSPDELKLELDSLFWPDTYSSLEDSLGQQFQAMRTHVIGARKDITDFSLVLYGPPGTGKSTLLEALAKSSVARLVEVTPSDILIGGSAQIERHTRLVFAALAMLTQCVILFDEFDRILSDRKNDSGPAQSEFQFLTPGLLPKLKQLHDRADKQQLAYALATNFVGRLDPAAIRPGRFDRMLGVFPPDLLSRVGRLATEMQKHCDGSNQTFDETTHGQRALAVISESAGHGMATLGKPGWFTKPPRHPRPQTLFGHIFEDYSLPGFGNKETRPNGAEDSNQYGDQELEDWQTAEHLDMDALGWSSSDKKSWRAFVRKVERSVALTSSAE